MVLAIPFSTVIMLYVNTARLHNRMGRVVAVQCSSAVLVIGLATVLLGRLGVDGAGWASLVAEGSVAAVVIVPLVRMLRADRRAARRASASRASDGRGGRLTTGATQRSG